MYRHLLVLYSTMYSCRINCITTAQISCEFTGVRTVPSMHRGMNKSCQLLYNVFLSMVLFPLVLHLLPLSILLNKNECPHTEYYSSKNIYFSKKQCMFLIRHVIGPNVGLFFGNQCFWSYNFVYHMYLYLSCT